MDDKKLEENAAQIKRIQEILRDISDNSEELANVTGYTPSISLQNDNIEDEVTFSVDALGTQSLDLQIDDNGKFVYINSQGQTPVDINNYINNTNVTYKNALGQTQTYNTLNTSSNKKLLEDKNQIEKQSKKSQAATSINGKTTKAAAEAPVTTEQLSSASVDLRNAKDAENKAKESFQTASKQINKGVIEASNGPKVLTNLKESENKLDNLYPEPSSVQPTSQQQDLLNKYDNVSDVPSDDVAAYTEAQNKQNSYENAIENNELRKVIKNYNSQVSASDNGVIDNGENTLESIDARLEDPTISNDEKEGLESLRENVSVMDSEIQSNPDVASNKQAYQTSKANLIEAQNERQEKEEVIRNLKTKEGAEKATENLNEADQRTISNIQNFLSINPRRPTSLLDARSLRNSNKIVVNTFTNRNASPFYLQMPTLNAITSFHLRNGFSPYGDANPSEIARDALHFNIFEGALGNMEIRDIPETNLKTSVLKNAKETTMGSFTIYPNDPDWMSLSHNHAYSDENPIASMVNPILQFVNTGSNVLKTIANISSNEPTSARSSRRIDFIDQYQNTEKLSITIPFVLFTKGEFIRDIYSPIMFLTALSYPKRLYTSDLDDDGSRIARVAQSTNTGSETADDVLKYVGEGVDKGTELAGYLEDIALKYGNTGAFRYVISQRPEYLSVRHASGLFFFKLAVITNFSYSYKGPWINSRGEVLPEESNARNAIEFQSAVKSMNSRNFNRTKMPMAFPSIAECSLTVKSVEPLFRQDWLQLLYGAGDPSGRSIVRVSEEATGSKTSNIQPQRTNFSQTSTVNNIAATTQNTPTKPNQTENQQTTPPPEGTQISSDMTESERNQLIQENLTVRSEAIEKRSINNTQLDSLSGPDGDAYARNQYKDANNGLRPSESNLKVFKASRQSDLQADNDKQDSIIASTEQTLSALGRGG